MPASVFFSYSDVDGEIVDVYLDAIADTGLATRQQVFCFEGPGALGTAGRVISGEVRAALAAPVAIAVVAQELAARATNETSPPNDQQLCSA